MWRSRRTGRMWRTTTRDLDMLTQIASITLLWGGTIESDFFRDFVVITAVMAIVVIVVTAVVYELYRIKSRDEAEADAFFDSAGMGKRDVDGFEGEQVGATFETGVELEYDHGTGGTGEVIPMDTYMDEDEDDSSSLFATMGGSVDPMLGPSTGGPSNPVFSGDVYGDPYSVEPSLSTPPPPRHRPWTCRLSRR